MPSLGVPRSHWPVVAWIRLKLPPATAPLTLMGPPLPPDPPLEILEKNPVATDPRKRVYAFEQEVEWGIVRLIWDADDPELLEAELRAPVYGARVPKEQVREFWNAVKALIAPIGPLPVEGADPRP
ncbi:MAG: hypothetical protein L3K00_08880 [Thermoplasmata archaeon]|nr:hypothetical protein [Thermoplasmata archaeon]